MIEGRSNVAKVTLENVTKLFPGTDKAAVNALSLDIRENEIFGLVGANGSGKSTALRIVAGIERINSGRVYLNERDISKLRPQDRDIAMVFDRYALYPHMTVRENLSFALSMAGVSPDEITRRVELAAKHIEVSEALDAKPDTISSAERQRVAIARALIRKPQVFLMDRPFAALPIAERLDTLKAFADLARSLSITTIYATTQLKEALYVCDRIALLNDGNLVKLGTSPEFELAETA